MKNTNPEVSGHLEKAIKSLESGSALIRFCQKEFLLERGRDEVSKESVDLDLLLDHLAAEAEASARNKGLSFVSRVTPGLLAVSDPVMLDRILRNLIVNAVRYTAAGGKISLDCRVDRGKALISVSDTGIGIPKHKRKEIFQEFTRLDEAKKADHQGLGIGLFSVKQLADKLKHKISVKSNDGVGSTFTLAVQLTKVHLKKELPKKPEKKGEALDVLLVIDDDEVDKDLCRELEAWGHAILKSNCARHACASLPLCSGKPDLVIINSHLRNGEDAEMVLTAIRQEAQATVPAIVIAEKEDTDILKRATELDFSVLLKPVAPKLMRDVINMAVGKAEGSARADEAASHPEQMQQVR